MHLVYCSGAIANPSSLLTECPGLLASTAIFGAPLTVAFISGASYTYVSRRQRGTKISENRRLGRRSMVISAANRQCGPSAARYAIEQFMYGVCRFETAWRRLLLGLAGCEHNRRWSGASLILTPTRVASSGATRDHQHLCTYMSFRPELALRSASRIIITRERTVHTRPFTVPAAAIVHLQRACCDVTYR